jgi:hypothetical protein
MTNESKVLNTKNPGHWTGIQVPLPGAKWMEVTIKFTSLGYSVHGRKQV